MIGLRMTDSERGLEEYQKIFDFKGNIIKVRIRLVLGRNYHGNLRGIWREALANDDLIYLKTHAGYGRHLSLSDDVSYFTDAMKNGPDFETIVSKMNDEYGIPHYDEEDDPADMRLDRKMVTYSTGKR
ncbi:MAG: hypothetical protein KKG76_01300 [Euryarchaeota archaeon]|nr:hypothetical protein [Euryarchaeota archaeon]